MASANVQRTIANQTAQAKRKELDIYEELDPDLDFTWANYYAERNPLSYFDYYYTGQDVKIHIEGAQQYSVSDPGVSPFVEISYSTQQEKTPVYGAHSYTFDAVMRGTRLTIGMFRLATTYPNKLRDILTEAAKTRAGNRGLTPIRGLDVDETNIEQYWGRHLNDDTTKDRNLFSIHPPFNIVVEYGIQSLSVADDPTRRSNEVIGRYNDSDSAMFTDVNERLVHSSYNSGFNYVILNNCEITSKQVEVSPEGTVCSEVYAFFARDTIDSD